MEFRKFLLYVWSICLKGLLSDDVCSDFMVIYLFIYISALLTQNFRCFRRISFTVFCPEVFLALRFI